MESKEPPHVCESIPRNNMVAAALCHQDFAEIMKAKQIRPRANSRYKQLFINLASGRFATVTQFKGKEYFEIGLELLFETDITKGRIFEIDLADSVKFLGLDSSKIERVRNFLAWVPIGETFEAQQPPDASLLRQVPPAVEEDEVELFMRFARAPNPHFVASSSPKSSIPLKHVLEPPASEDHLLWLRRALDGVAPELLELHARADGARLFVDESDEKIYFSMLRIGEMEVEKRQLERWLSLDGARAGDDYSEGRDSQGRLVFDGIPDWWESALVISAFGWSPDRIYMPIKGAHAGCVFAYDSGEERTVRVAASVNQFLHLIRNDPVNFVRDLCNVAYFEIEKYETG